MNMKWLMQPVLILWCDGWDFIHETCIRFLVKQVGDPYQNRDVGIISVNKAILTGARTYRLKIKFTFKTT